MLPYRQHKRDACTRAGVLIKVSNGKAAGLAWVQVKLTNLRRDGLSILRQIILNALIRLFINMKYR